MNSIYPKSAISEYIKKIRDAVNSLPEIDMPIDPLSYDLSQETIALLDNFEKYDEKAYRLTRIDNLNIYKSINDAINNMKELNWLIYVEGSSKYILFDNIEEYIKYKSVIHEQEIIVYEIILEKNSRKFVIIYEGSPKEKDLKLLKNEIFNCLNKKYEDVKKDNIIIKYDHNRKQCEIVVLDILVDNYQKNGEIFNIVFDKIRFVNKDLSKKISHPTYKECLSKNYNEYILTDKQLNLHTMQMEIVKDYIKSIISITDNKQIIINIGCVNNYYDSKNTNIDINNLKEFLLDVDEDEIQSTILFNRYIDWMNKYYPNDFKYYQRIFKQKIEETNIFQFKRQKGKSFFTKIEQLSKSENVNYKY